MFFSTIFVGSMGSNDGSECALIENAAKNAASTRERVETMLLKSLRSNVAYQGTMKKYMALSEGFALAGLSVFRHIAAQIESSPPYAPVFCRWQVLIGADATDMAVGCCRYGKICNPNAKPLDHRRVNHL